MKIARVIGRVVLSQSVFPKPGSRLLLVSPMGIKEIEAQSEVIISSQSNFVTYDDLGAHLGDIVGIVEGGEAMRPFDYPMPIDAYNAAIIDTLNLESAN